MTDVIVDYEALKVATKRCYDDFEFFARTCLKVIDKEGNLAPFVLNKEQKLIHERLENQLKTKKKVRAIILKARQMGCSTYIAARYYWKLWRTFKGKSYRAFVLTHRDEATDNLFNMTKRYHDNLPEHIRPPVSKSNAKELVFADTGCNYTVGTAGGVEIGRSLTLHYVHSSECAFWPNAEMHVTSLLNTALSDGDGTESVIESTANGIGNVFHNYWQAAVAGNSEYEAIFLPWFMHDEYVKDCPPDWDPPAEFLEYGQVYGLTWEQLYWAFIKNREAAYAAGLEEDKITPKFKQEFPSCAEESFQTTGNSFISAISILKARKPEVKIQGTGPIILGVDPARTGDKVGIIDRCGRRAGERIADCWEPGGNLVHLAERVAHTIDKIRPDAVCIDVGGNGAAIYDNLLDWGYDRIINAVNFGSKPIGRGPTGDELYANRRAEMWDNMRHWLLTEGGVQIPDSDFLQMDLMAPIMGPGATRTNANNELIIEEKDKIKKRLKRSTDIADALCLTFALTFASGHRAQFQPSLNRRKVNRRTGY